MVNNNTAGEIMTANDIIAIKTTASFSDFIIFNIFYFTKINKAVPLF